MQPVVSPASLTPLLVSPASDGHYPGRPAYPTLGGASATCLLTASETGGAFSLFLLTAQPGFCVPPHVHQNEDEAFCVLEGSLSVQIGEETVTLLPGGSAWGPRGVAHSISTAGDTPCRALICSTPGGFENFFADLNNFGGLLPGESEPEMIGRMVALMGRHGLTPAAPAPQQTNAASLIGPGVGDFVELGDHRGNLRITSENTDGALLWAGLEVDANGGVPPHLHEREDETFYIVSGRFAFEVDGKYFEAGPGDTVFGPRGIAHAWQCLSSEGGRVEVLITPGDNFEAFFRTLSAFHFVASQDMVNPARMAQLMALTAKHQIEMLLPIK